MCSENHIALVLVDDAGTLRGICTLIIERKCTHGLCKLAHVENMYMFPDVKETLIRKLLEALVWIARHQGCYRVDFGLKRNYSSRVWEGLFDSTMLFEQYVSLQRKEPRIQGG